MTKQKISDLIMKTLDNGYHNRKDYPPLAITSWDDRNRYREYVRKILNELEKEGKIKLLK